MTRNASKLLQCLRTLRYEPDSADALFTLGVIYATEGHRSKALRFLRKVQALEAAYPGLRRFMDKVLQRHPPAGEIREALQ